MVVIAGPASIQGSDVIWSAPISTELVEGNVIVVLVVLVVLAEELID